MLAEDWPKAVWPNAEDPNAEADPEDPNAGAEGVVDWPNAGLAPKVGAVPDPNAEDPNALLPKPVEGAGAVGAGAGAAGAGAAGEATAIPGYPAASGHRTSKEMIKPSWL